MEKGEIKRTSGMSEAVGFNAEGKKEIYADAEGVFNEQYFEEWEREKTLEEQEIIEGILSKLPDFVKKYGGEPLALTEDHVHIVDEEKVTEDIRKEFSGSGAKYNFLNQFVVVFAEPHLQDGDNKLYFAHKVLHELLHFSSFQSYQPSKEFVATERRSGFSVRMRGGKERYFNNVDEALIQEAVIMFDEEYFHEIPVLSEELERREEARKKVKEEGIYPSEMVALAGKNDVPLAYGYAADILNVRVLIHDVYLANRDKVSSADEVKTDFFRGVFTGKLLKVAKMVEKYGGKGAFRRLGEITKK